MLIRLFNLAVLILLAQITSLRAAVPYNFDVDLGGKASRYTPILVRIAKNWPPFSRDEELPPAPSTPMSLRCFSTPGSPFFVGVRERMWVRASLGAVDSVLSDINHYADLFPGYKEVRIVHADGNRLLTRWEQIIPVFFLPNVIYDLNYVIDRSHSDKIIYRFQLSSGDHIRSSDGLIVVEPVTPSLTRYTEYDFWDADYGLLGTLAPGRIWRESVEDVVLSDLAIQLKATYPEWSYEKVRNEADRQLQKDQVESAIRTRLPFPLLPDQTLTNTAK